VKDEKTAPHLEFVHECNVDVVQEFFPDCDVGFLFSVEIFIL